MPTLSNKEPSINQAIVEAIDKLVYARIGNTTARSFADMDAWQKSIDRAKAHLKQLLDEKDKADGQMEKG